MIKYLFTAIIGLSIFQQHFVEYGKASYYADRFMGRKTASGELYHPDSLTAAHKTLKFGTIVNVRNVRNGKSVIVRINDRGPFVEGRIIDLSGRAMRALNGIDKGVIDVKIEPVIVD